MNRVLRRCLAGTASLVMRVSERSTLVRDRCVRPLTLAFVASAVSAWERGGVAAWEAWHLPLVREIGRARAAYLEKKLAIDPTSARSLGKIHDYEDPLLGIEGFWEYEGRARAVRVETACPIGEVLLARRCPDFCKVLVHAFETATLEAMNPGYTLEPLTELRSAGAARCTFVHRLG